MAAIERRTDQAGKTTFRVKIRLKGHPPQTETFTRLTDARKWAASVESAIREGRHFPASTAKRRTVADIIDRYVRDVLPHKAPGTAETQGLQLEWWRKHLGDYRLSDVTPAVLAEFRDKLTAEPGNHGRPRSGPTVNRYLAAISHVLTLASREWDYLNENPAKRVTRKKEAAGRVRFLTADERRRLLDVCKTDSNPDLYPAVVLALSTGARRGEILGLTRADVDLKRGLLTFRQTKNGETRAVPVRGHALDILKERSKVEHISGLLFPGKPKADPTTGKVTFKPVGLHTAFTRAVNAAGIVDFHWHDMRHDAASTLAMAGCSAVEIAELLGHKTLQMTRRYSHLSRDHLEGLADRLAAQVDGTAGKG